MPWGGNFKLPTDFTGIHPRGMGEATGLHPGMSTPQDGELAHGPELLLTQKCGDVINTQQAGRSKWNKTRDLLGFNTEPADSENPTTCQSI